MKFILNGDKLTIERGRLERQNSGSLEYYKADVEFDEEWQGLAIEARLVKCDTDDFEPVGRAIAVINNELFIDNELNGSYGIGFIGYRIENDIKTYQISTNLKSIWLDKGAGQIKPYNSESIPTEWEIYLAQVQEFIDDANDILDDANDKIEAMTEALEDVNEAITQTNNLDLDANKVEKTTTVSITKKNGSVKTVQIADGLSLQFMWQGTSLGIKTEDQQEYTFVDLQGIQGPIGPQGDAFQIKKTYSTIQQMVADYDNMQINDYVMISGNVEQQENATLWTKTEEVDPDYKWQYLADFSGATGIQGPTGLTPNIQIGTVTSGDNPSVTRSGTDENPILNFVLVKGDKGDTGNTGPTGNGIESITKTGTVDTVDTYTILFTNGQTTTFQVTNGEVSQAQLNVVIDECNSLRNDLNKATLDTTDTPSDNIMLENTIQAQLKKFVLKGKTEQDTTTGKNGFNGAHQDGAGAGATSTFSNNILTVSATTTSAVPTAVFNLYDEVVTGDIIRFAGIIKNSNGKIVLQRYYNGSWGAGKSLEYIDGSTIGNESYTVPSGATAVRLLVYANTEIPSGDTSASYENIIVTKNNDNMTYEPYTGGIPSPNPTYPQEIKNVEPKNKFNINSLEGTSNITVSNDKLILAGTNDYHTTDQGTNLKDIADLKVGETYILSFKTTYTGTNANKIYIRGTSSYWENETSLTITQAMLDDRIAFYGTNNSEISELMISENGGEYAPYGCIGIKRVNKNLHSGLRLGYYKQADGTYNTSSQYACSINPIYVCNAESFIYSIDNEVCNGYAYEYDINGNYLGRKSIPATGVYTPTSGTAYFNYGFKDTYITTVPLDSKAQIEEENTRSSYVAHAEKTYNFPLSEGQKLMQDGTIEKKVVNPRRHRDLSTLIWTKRGTNEQGISTYSATLVGRKFASNLTPLCSKFLYLGIKTASTMASEGIGFAFYYDRNNVDKTIYVNSTQSTVENLLTELADAVLEYELETPDETEFTQAQQEVYDEIIKDGTYDEVTHYSSNALVNPDIDAVGILDPKSILSRIEALENQGE